MAAPFEPERGPPTLKDFPKITTEKIGQILHEEYQPYQVPNENRPIDYFYLQIRKRFIWKKREINARDKILQALLDLPQSWMKVYPGREWPSIFFGHFPRAVNETEREQEERLNRDVRVKLKTELEEKLAGFGNPEKPDKKPTIHIMITRVCKYTGPDREFLEATEIGEDEL